MVECWMSEEVLSSLAALLVPALGVLLSLLLVWRVVAGQPSPSSLPCLPSLPVLGSLLSLRSDLPRYLLFTSLGHRYGEIYGLYLGPHYTVVVSNFKLAREVLLQKGKEFAGRPKMVTTDLLSRGGKNIAFANYGPLWKCHRRLVQSSFSMFGTTKLQTIVFEQAASLCSDMLKMAEQPLDPGPVLMRAVTNVVCSLVFGSTYQPHDPELKVVMDYNTGIVQTIARGALVDIFHWLRFFPNKDLTRLKECIKVRDELLNKKLEEHKASYNSEDTRDIMDALLKGQQSSGEESAITDDHILMTAADAFGAGVETTTTTVLWVLAFLLHNPEVQEKIHLEMDEQVGRDRTPSLADRGRLPYLESTLNEVMRIRPVTPILVPHVALQDTSIGGHHIPKGTGVMINMWSIHHDPRLWEEPEKFMPERFLDSEGQRLSPPCFLPFGAGTRVCVGESLARLQVFLFTSWLLQRFTFSLPPGAPLPDLQGRCGVVLQPLKFNLSARPRFSWANVEA